MVVRSTEVGNWKLEESPEWGKERMCHVFWLLYPEKNLNVASGEKWDKISCSIRMATINNAEFVGHFNLFCSQEQIDEI